MELKTEQRIDNMLNSNKEITTGDYLKVMRAFEKLILLSKLPGELSKSRGKKAFLLNKTEYVEIMNWINQFMQSKGFDEIIFRTPDSFEISSDDYDYYYEFKTPTQYIAEENARYSRND